jgi:hypothetical protein
MLLISAFLSEISATSASGFFMDHAESMGSGRQQWTSDILEWLRNQDERRPLLPTQEPVARLGNWKGHHVGTVERNEPEEKGVRDCPNAEIVLDQFHVLANFGKQVLDRIRVNEANRCRDDKAARELIKGAKWLLLGNWENLPNRKSKTKLNALLEANQALMTAYVMKDALKGLWAYTREGWARKAWETGWGWLAPTSYHLSCGSPRTCPSGSRTSSPTAAGL